MTGVSAPATGRASTANETLVASRDPVNADTQAGLLHGMSGEKNQYVVREQDHGSLPRHGLEPGAPIAQVLNSDVPMPCVPQPSTILPATSTTPFSGRLVDLLLDLPEPREQWEKNEQFLRESGTKSSVIQLPKLPQLPPSVARRPRIPPLLQGLHQPPPLPPSSRLFPPITSEKSAFPSDASNGDGFDTRSEGPRMGRTSNYLNPLVDNVDSGEYLQQESSVHDSSIALSSNTQEMSSPDRSKSKNDEDPPSQGAAKCKSTRKRIRWSEQETKDLITGVRKYGIGNWKKILQDPGLNFQRRTAVDLKDRFRVCCLRDKASSQKSQLDEPLIEQHLESLPEVSKAIIDDSHASKDDDQTSLALGIAEAPKESQPCTAPLNVEESAMSGPFRKSTRRPRRKFSLNDDVNLLKGFEKYGPVWHNMRNDVDLGFGARHPTDLRDRFRIKFPDKYAKAGYKLKSTQGHSVTKEDDASTGQATQHQRHPSDSSVPAAIENSPSKPGTRRVSRPTDTIPDTSYLSPLGSNYRPAEIMPYLFNPPPTLFEDYTGSDNTYAAGSPIILNRDILQWADANYSSSISTTLAPTYIQAPDTIPGDLALNIFASNDGLHINPSATITSQSATPRQDTIPSSTTDPGPPSPPTTTTTTTHTLNVNSALNSSYMGPTGTDWSAPFPGTTSLSMPTTPNLPTIVFPHVPVASARTTLHKFPTPADLLHGLDLEKPVGQGSGVVVVGEEGLGGHGDGVQCGGLT